MVSDSSKSEKVHLKEIKAEIIPQKFDFKKNVVAIVKLDDYQTENIKKALKSVIELLGIKDFFNYKSILLKPNALAPSKNAYTPQELVSTLIELLKSEKNVNQVIVGDSTMTKGLTNITFKRTKYKEICEALGVKLINFFESERSKVKLNNPNYDVEEYIYLPKEICESDLVINLPKLKTHSGYVYTGAIKNFFGILGNKMSMHMTHKNKKRFQEMLADIYFAVEETNNTNFPKVLTIMDGCISMEGKGPRSGKPRKVGLLIAGFNSAAVDIIGYTLMNGDPTHLDAIISLAKRTELPVDINQLEIRGEDYKDFIVKDFKKPHIALLKKSDKYSKIVRRIMGISIKIKQKRCTLCEQCVNHCPAGALVNKNERIEINREKCIECFCCGESCPNDAISAKFYIFRIIPLLIFILAVGSFIIIWFLIQFLTNLF